MQTRSWIFVCLPAFHLEMLAVSAARTRARTARCGGAVKVGRGVLEVMGQPSSTCLAPALGLGESSASTVLPSLSLTLLSHRWEAQH